MVNFYCNKTPPHLCWLVTLLFTGGDWLQAGSTCLVGERDGFSLWQGRGFKFTVVIGDWF